MRDSEKRRLINSLFSFSCSAFIIGFFFYSFVSYENYYRYEPIISFFNLFIFIINILIVGSVYNYSSILSETVLDYFKNEKTIGLQAGNVIGLLGLGVLNVILFNPFFSFPEHFDKGGEVTNPVYVIMTGFLFMGAVLLHSSRNQIKSLNE